MEELFLHESLLLLALRDEKGTVELGISIDYGLGGALLAELLFQNRIEIQKEKRANKVMLRDTTPFGDPILDACLLKLQKKKKPEKPDHWVSTFAFLKDLKHNTARRLVERGILQIRQEKILHLFTRKVYPEINPEPERRILAKMREAIFSETAEVDPRTAVLISLAKAIQILPAVFDKKELKFRKARIEGIAKGELIGQVTQEAIEAIHTALLVAATLPVTIAATSS